MGRAFRSRIISLTYSQLRSMSWVQRHGLAIVVDSAGTVLLEEPDHAGGPGLNDDHQSLSLMNGGTMCMCAHTTVEPHGQESHLRVVPSFEEPKPDREDQS